MSKVAIIGAGFSGLSAACYLALAGHEVDVYEKNSQPGGRARQLKTEEGFVFDMGPSWYWMPEIYDRFFNDFGYNVEDFYHLELLDPSFDVVFGQDDLVHVPAEFNALCALFEKIEKGSALKLRSFLAEAEYKYRKGVDQLAYKPGISILEFADYDLISGIFRLDLFSSFSKHVKKYFTNQKLISLMEFPVLFLGAMPDETPALYSLMNFACFKLGTWYPQGGFGKVVEAFVRLAESLGVQFHYNSSVEKINVINGKAESISVNGVTVPCEGIIATADYHHVENVLLSKDERNYSENYWQNKTLSPSCLIFYLGVNKVIKSINHHTLFFEESLSEHAQEIYKNPQWPSRPLFYMCCPSRTDATVAPKGSENIFLLLPIASGLSDTEEMREKYFNMMVDRIESNFNESIRDHIVFKKSYCLNDFTNDYHAYLGNAYGLANTLMQTAFLKPKIKNHQVHNLFYAGQLTVPGPGVPPAIISGKIASGLLNEQLKRMKHEAVI